MMALAYYRYGCTDGLSHFFLVVGLGVSRINGVCLPKCIIGFSDFKL